MFVMDTLCTTNFFNNLHISNGQNDILLYNGKPNAKNKKIPYGCKYKSIEITENVKHLFI